MPQVKNDTKNEEVGLNSNASEAARKPNNFANERLENSRNNRSNIRNDSYGLGLSVYVHQRVWPMPPGEGAEITSKSESLASKKNLEIGEDKIQKIQFHKADGTVWKIFSITSPYDYFQAMEELNKHNNSVSKNQSVTEATLYILDTNGPFAAAKKEQIRVPVLKGTKDVMF